MVGSGLLTLRRCGWVNTMCLVYALWVLNTMCLVYAIQCITSLKNWVGPGDEASITHRKMQNISTK